MKESTSATGKVLIVDDEELFREDLAHLLRREGYECETASSAEDALAYLDDHRADVVLTDIVLPGMNGIELTEAVLRSRTETTLIVMTAYGTLDTAIAAFRRGAADYVLKPIVAEDILGKLSRISDYRRLLNEVSVLRRRMHEQAESQTLVGTSSALREVLEQIQKVAPTESTVLISGESGTGKELVARCIHEGGARREQSFIAINCSGLQSSLLESELFGHTRGAFTGAIQDKVGLLEAAGRGTVLLDEVGEMPLDLQGKLLRVLEQREFRRVGDTATTPLRARILAATHRDLHVMVSEGTFRDDLYYRIAVFEIHVPPLRKRTEDIPGLVDHFVVKLNRDMARNCEGVTPEALEALMTYTWPGNIRELRNVIERAMILTTEQKITCDCLPQLITGTGSIPRSAHVLREAMHSYERALIERTLNETGWNKEETARRLGVNPSTLYRKLADLGIERSDRT